MFRGPASAPGEHVLESGEPPCLKPSRPIGKIQTIVGSLTVSRAGTALAHLGVGDFVYEADVIETGADSTVCIHFSDGTVFELSACTRMVLSKFACDGASSNSALFGLVKGAIAFMAGRVAKGGGLSIDTPVARIRGSRGGGIAGLTLAALTFALLDEVRADDQPVIDDDELELPHGTFVLETKEKVPRIIVVDDPLKTVVLRKVGSTVEADQVTNSSDRMDELEKASRDTFAIYRLGQQDPFIQHQQHAALGSGETRSDFSNVSIASSASSSTPDLNPSSFVPLSIVPVATNSTALPDYQPPILVPVLAPVQVPHLSGVMLAIDSGSSSSDSITNIGTLVVSGLAAGATPQYSIDRGATWTGSFTAVEGANTVLVRQVDSAGNVSAAISFNFILDTVAPGAPTIVSVKENPVINASEASDGTPVVVDLTGTDAMVGDKLTIHWGGQTVEYTLQASDITSHSAAVMVPAATIAAQGDGTFNVTAQLTDAAGNVGGVSTAFALTVDTVAPTVTSVTYPVGDGTLKAGETVVLTVHFDEAVTVTGNPTLALSSGGTATYTGGSGTSDLTFSYTVGAGENSFDLAVTTFNLNGATVQDAATNDANTAGAVTNPAGTLVIDTVAPTVTSVTYPVGDGALKAGETVVLTVHFDEAVTVTGNPTLALSSGGTATYTGGSGTSDLTFSYTVGAGENSFDLAVTTFNLNGATVQDAATNDANTAGAVTNPAGTLVIDTVAPTVTSVTYPVGDGTLKAGETVVLTVHFDEAVTVTGNPTLALSSGGTATYTGGSGTSDLTFSYTVGAGENSFDLAVTTFNLNGATVQDAATNDANTAGAVTNPAGTLVIDTVAPTVTSVTYPVGDGTLKAGETVVLTVHFDEAVTVTGNPTLALSSGGTATYTGGSGTSDLTFSYTVGAGENSFDLAVTTFNLNGATVQDAATNDANTAGAVTNPAGTLVIDTVAPTVTSVTYPVGDGTLKAGETVVLTVHFDEAVTVTGNPTLALSSGGTATYTGGSGTSDLTFSYTVGAGENSFDLAVTTFNLNGATVQDAATNDANTAGAVTNPAGTLVIDTVAPTVTSVTYPVGDGALKAGETVVLTVHFDEAVTVTGNPTLALSSGGTATYTGGSGTSDLTFSYTVGAGENSFDLAVTTFNLNGATVQDAATNDANTAGAVTNPAGTLVIDTVAPTVTSVTYPVGDGTLKAGETVVLTVHFDEAVTVTGNPTLALSSGGTATYTGGSGTSDLTFSYTVGAGENSFDLAVTTFNLNGATVQDAATNDANTAGAVTNPAGTLVIDTVAPTVTSVTYPVGDGALKAGETVVLTVHFDEAVTVTGNPTLALSSGGTATYTGGSGTSDLTFSYTVGAGENSFDLAVTTFNLNGATVQDAATNDANTAGAVTNPAGTLVIDTTAPTATIVVADTVLQAGETSLVTITLSEAVSGLTTDDLTVENGTLTNLSSLDGGITWTATLTPTANVEDATNVITLDNTGVQDAASNTGVGTTTSNNYAVDTGDPNDFDELATGETVVIMQPYVYGTPDNDGNKITGGGNNGQIIYAGAGDDDPLNGTGANDIIYGGSGNDNIKGNGGDDIIFGGSGADTIDGTNGNDIIYGGFGADTLKGGNGDDILVYLSVADSHGGQFDTVTGFSPGDQIDLTAFGAGAFTTFETTPLATETNLVAAHTIAWFYDGTQTIIYANPTDGDLNGGSSSLLEIHLTGVQSVQMSDFSLASADPLIGGSRADTIDGALGNEIIYGGLGADTLTGGGGDDKFVYFAVTESPGDLFDTITDFGSTDQIDLTAFGAGAFTTFETTPLATETGLVKAHTIAYFADSGTTTIYANPTQQVLNGGAPGLLEIQLVGFSSIQKANFLTANILIAALPAGVAGEPINLGLTTPTTAGGALITMTIADVPSGWTVNGGTLLDDGTWTVQTTDPNALTITSPADFAGATLLNVTETWTQADGSTVSMTFADNVEVYPVGSPIFALSDNDYLTGSSGQDLFVFAQPIGYDVIYSFDASHDQIDLIGYAGIASFDDVKSHLTADANGDAVITLADGQSITLNGVTADSLSANDFVFDQTPVTDNAGAMAIGDGALLPLSGAINNAGTIALDSIGHATTLELIQHGITLQGGGQLILSDSDANLISSAAPGVTFTNTDNTISGAGQLGDWQMTLVNNGTIVATGAHALIIDTGSNAVINTGTLDSTGSGGLIVNSDVSNAGLLWAHGGDITVNGSVSGAGGALITGDATLEFAAAASINVTFVGADDFGTLVLDNPAVYTGQIFGFTGTSLENSDIIDLKGITFDVGTSWTYHDNIGFNTGGILTVDDTANGVTVAVDSITFGDGEYTTANFILTSDGNGGTLIADPPEDHATTAIDGGQTADVGGHTGSTHITDAEQALPSTFDGNAGKIAAFALDFVSDQFDFEHMDTNNGVANSQPSHWLTHADLPAPSDASPAKLGNDNLGGLPENLGIHMAGNSDCLGNHASGSFVFNSTFNQNGTGGLETAQIIAQSDQTVVQTVSDVLADAAHASPETIGPAAESVTIAGSEHHKLLTDFLLHG